MKFLVDAQLPRRLAKFLQQLGHDAIHTLDMPHGNRTTDSQINERANQEQRVVITKDADFTNSFLLAGQPAKLLAISTGNIKNSDLEALFASNAPAIIKAFEAHDYIELTHHTIVIHE